jgi:hypothetical protein
MTSTRVSSSLVPGMLVKIGLPLLIGLITLLSAEAAGVTGRNSLVLAAVLVFGFALVLFVVDTELRILSVDERVAVGFARLGQSVGMPPLPERSIIDAELLADLLRAVSQTDAQVNPLLQRLARREMELLASFVRQLPAGSAITYDGEDRDWLLGLTREAERSIDAISLPTVDAGATGLDGGLWTSDLGIRYVELQREAIVRKVRIRRIFVFDTAEMGRDETFAKITQRQQDVGVEVRKLGREFVPGWLESLIFDFIVFDGIVGYETTPASQFISGETRPGKLRTLLAPERSRVRELQERFELLWEHADPDRKIDE